MAVASVAALPDGTDVLAVFAVDTDVLLRLASKIPSGIRGA